MNVAIPARARRASGAIASGVMESGDRPGRQMWAQLWASETLAPRGCLGANRVSPAFCGMRWPRGHPCDLDPAAPRLVPPDIRTRAGGAGVGQSPFRRAISCACGDSSWRGRWRLLPLRVRLAPKLRPYRFPRRRRRRSTASHRPGPSALRSRRHRRRGIPMRRRRHRRFPPLPPRARGPLLRPRARSPASRATPAIRPRRHP